MDGPDTTPAVGDDSGFDQFLTAFLPPDASKKPSEEQPENHEEQPEDKPDPKSEDLPDEEAPKDDEETDASEDDAEPDKKYAEEGVFVKIKVGDKDHEVSVKDLQRLYGQEAALTQKSQQVSDQRKLVDAEVQKNSAATAALLDRAMKRYEPYSKVDFNLAAAQLSPEEYTALRNEAMAAYQDVEFLTQHVDAYSKHIQQQQQTGLRERATATLKELADPEKGIEGWNETMYQDMVKTATSKYGVPSDVMANMVDSWAFRIIHDAMLYNKGKDVNANVKVTKVNKTPKKVVKTTTPPSSARGQDGNKAMKRLQTTGSTDDAADAFMERWADKD